MRIRTIKPDFWCHPVMAQENDCVKLMAIGLLNFADDEGYFFADAKLVRNAIRPFDDDSVITHGALTRLSGIGYISLKKHDTHGILGFVISFRKHQVINRPSPSIIKGLYDSVSDHGSIIDHSLLERKGMEGNGIADTQQRAETIRELPSWEIVKARAGTIGLAEWKARDWFDEMDGCGWLDYAKRPIQNWGSVMSRVKAKWEADGRPSGPPRAKSSPNRQTEADRDRINTGLDEGIKIKRLNPVYQP